MKQISKHLQLLIVCFLITGFACMAQTTAAADVGKNKNNNDKNSNYEEWARIGRTIISRRGQENTAVN